MIRVLIVDDHPFIRKGLRAELEDASDIKVIDEAMDGDEALTKIRSSKPDIVLLDISLKERSGFDVLKQLHTEMPYVKVLMLTAFPEKQYAVRCLKNGAKGYLTKRSTPHELLTALKKVMTGGIYVSAELADILALEIDPHYEKLPHEELSDREFQVLCLLGQGKTVTEIAKTLFLSLPTISSYRARILEKTGMQTTAQLIHYVAEQGLAKMLE